MAGVIGLPDILEGGSFYQKVSVLKHPEVGLPVPLVSGPIVIVVTVVTLTLSYRKFSPRQKKPVNAPVVN